MQPGDLVVSLIVCEVWKPLFRHLVGQRRGCAKTGHLVTFDRTQLARSVHRLDRGEDRYLWFFDPECLGKRDGVLEDIDLVIEGREDVLPPRR